MNWKTKSALFGGAFSFCFIALPALYPNVILFDTYKDTPEETAHIVSVASSKLGESGLNSLLRLDDLALPYNGSLISLSYTTVNSGNGTNPNNGANISWDLTGSGAELFAIYVFGGSNGANLYKVTDAAQMISGSTTVNTPVTGKSGKFATISHILLLGTGSLPPPVAVPEGGTTLVLLASALGLIIALGRFANREAYLRRRAG
jgi:hypothetical protein